MNIKFHSCLLLIFVSFLFACTSEDITNIFIPEDVDQYAREYIQTIRSGDYSGTLLEMDPDVAKAYKKSMFEQLRCYLNLGQVVSTELVNGRVTKFKPLPGADWKPYSRYSMDYYIQYSSVDLGHTEELDIPAPDEKGVCHQIIKIIVDKTEGKTTIFSFEVNYLSGPLTPPK